MRQSPQTSYPSSATSSTVRRIFTIPMGMPVLTSSSESSVRMISAGDEVDKDIVILDSGSDVSLLPLSYGHCGMDAVRQEEVQLRDCHGSHLKVTGYRTVSLVVRDGDGTEAELEHAFLIANVKSCILSLGQLYRNGWCVKQMDDGSGPCLESPDKKLHIPVFYERNSLAMKATVSRVEQVGDEVQLSPHACVRAIVELKDKFRPENPRNNAWQVADGHPYLRCIAPITLTPDQRGQPTLAIELLLCKRGRQPVKTTDGTSWRSVPSIWNWKIHLDPLQISLDSQMEKMWWCSQSSQRRKKLW